MYRMRSRNWSGRRIECNGRLPGFIVFLILDICPVYPIKTVATSHLREDSMSSLSSNAQSHEQFLLFKLVRSH